MLHEFKNSKICTFLEIYEFVMIILALGVTIPYSYT